MQIFDDISNKNLPAVSFSGGGCRAYCSSIGILRSLYKNKLTDKIPYFSAVSGSSWLILILSHLDNKENALLFDIDYKFKKFNDDQLLKIPKNISPMSILPSFLYFNSTDVGNRMSNYNILSHYDLHECSPCKCEKWPTYIIGSCHWKDNEFHPIDITHNYSYINNEIVPHDELMSLTNIITASSYIISIIPSLFSYEMNFNNQKFCVNDGAYIDKFSLGSLLRRKCKRIFSTAAILLNSDGTIKIRDWIDTNDRNNYEEYFESDDWNRVINNINDKIFEGEICCYKTTMRVKNNVKFSIEAYECEILFYFVTKVNEFMDTIPNDIKELPEMSRFPTFLLLLENSTSLMMYTNIQCYTLIALTEWCVDRIIKIYPEFFTEKI